MSKIFDTGIIYFDIFLYLILITKIIYILLKLFDNVIVTNNILSRELVDSLIEFTEKAFFILMSLLLIILFNPITEKYMIFNHHIKLFLFVFGILELISQLKIPTHIKTSVFKA